MNDKNQKTVMVKRFRYLLDWFTVDDVECGVGNGFSYEMQYRLGSWYLSGEYYDFDERKWRNDYTKSFQLEDPVSAVISLGVNLRSFSVMHNAVLSEVVKQLMQKVEAKRGCAA
ncbi:MAG: hypothetical protein E6265_25935 [Enterobacteriaceae bacterium]|nr:hypothetical protein [Enterobacteriaceae bacterium]